MQHYALSNSKYNSLECQSLPTSLCWCFNWNASRLQLLAAGRTISEQVKLLTTGAFDGTGNVSGAVTLLNSAVISKVLTGMLQVQVL
jgi:hypothetical protein